MDLSTLPAAPLSPSPPPSVPSVSSVVPPSWPSVQIPASTTPVPHNPDQPFHLPNGQPLHYTLGVETLMRQIFRDDTAYVFDVRDGGPVENLVFLWFCAHNPPALPGHPRAPRPWQQMGPGPDGSQLPLYLRPFDLSETVLAWADDQFPGMELLGFQILALSLWNHHHGAEIIVDPGYTSGAEPEKKNLTSPTLTPSTHSSTSSPEATPPSATPSSGTSPCATPSPAATATSSPSASTASAPPPMPSGRELRQTV